MHPPAACEGIYLLCACQHLVLPIVLIFATMVNVRCQLFVFLRLLVNISSSAHTCACWPSGASPSGNCLCPSHIFLLGFLVCLPVECSTNSTEENLQHLPQSRSDLWGWGRQVGFRGLSSGTPLPSVPDGIAFELLSLHKSFLSAYPVWSPRTQTTRVALISKAHGAVREAD